MSGESLGIIDEGRYEDVEELDLDDNYLVGEQVYVIQGKILENPFSKKIENSEAAMWMISNRLKVENSIEIQLRKQAVRGGNASDCFNMLMNEFNTRTDLQFNKNYFGKGTDYTVGDYVLNRVKYTVQRYKNDLITEDSTPFLTTEENKTFRQGVVDEGIGGSYNADDVVNTDNLYWDSLFNQLLFNFRVFLEERKYREFNAELMVALLYFNVEDFNDVVDVEKHYKKVSEKSGEPYEVVTTIVEDMTESVKDGEDCGIEILRIVKELLEGKGYGWRPYVLRKDD